MIKRILLTLCALLAAALPAFAQNTTQVTGQVIDPNGWDYSGGTAIVQLSTPGATVTVNNQAQCSSGGYGSAPCQVPINGQAGPATLDSTGTFHVTLYPNASISPAGTHWLFTINYPGTAPPIGTGGQTFSVPITIAGATQNISSTLTAAAPVIINATTGGTGVTSLNGLTGALTIAPGANITVTPSGGNTLTIASTATGGGTIANPVNLTDTFDRSSLGANYINLVNAVIVSSGTATGSNGTQYSIAGYTGASSTAVQHAVYIVGSLGDGMSAQGPALLISGTAHTSISLYVCEDVSNVIGVAKITGIADASHGTPTLLASTSTTSAVGDILDFSYVDGTLSCTQNAYSSAAVGVQVADASLTTGVPGFLLYSSTAQSSGFSLNNPPNEVSPACDVNIVADGDSVSALGGPTSGDYTTSGLIVRGSLNPCLSDVAVAGKCLGVVCATGSSVGNIASMVSTAAAVVDPFFVNGIPNYVVIWGCTNDIALGGQTAAQCYADMTTYIAARHAAGWKVIAVPPLSRSGWDNAEADLRALVAANSAGADAVVTLPPSMASLGAFRNSLLFVSGGIHPTSLGNSLIKDAIAAALNSLR